MIFLRVQFIFLIISGILNAGTFSEEYGDLKFKTSGYFESKIKQSEFTNNTKNLKNEKVNLSMARIKAFSKLEYNNLSIHNTLIFQQNSKAITFTDYNGFYADHVKKDIYVDDLYLQYVFLKNNNIDYSLAYGSISLSGGNFKKYSYNDIKDSNMLYTMTNITVLGPWFVMSSDNFIFRLGYGEWIYNSYTNNTDLREFLNGSKGYYSSFEYNFKNPNSLQLIELNYFKITTIYDFEGYKPFDMTYENLYALGYSYENFENSYVLYTILMYSDVYERAGTFKDEHHLPSFLYTSDNRFKGQAILLGTKKYIDIKGNEYNIGFEYFGTSKNFVSVNIGDYFDNNYGIFPRRGTDMYTIYGGVNIDNKYFLNIKAFESNNKYSADIGIANTTDKPIKGLFGKEIGISLSFIWKF